MLLNSQRVGNFVDGAFDWLETHLDLFDPFKDKPEPDMYRCKAMLELVCMCMYYQRRVGSNDDPRSHRIVSFVNAVWQRPNYRELVVRSPERFRLYGMTYIALMRCGSVDRSYHEILQGILDEGYASVVEEVPYRAIDFRHMLDCGDFKHNLPSYDRLYQETLLAKTPPLLYLTDEDVYSITHTIFYLADFGFRRATAIPEEQLPTVRWMIATLIGMYLRQRNWDLVAELLLNCRCLHWSPPLVFDTAWDALLAAQLADGSVPGPAFSEAGMSQLSEPDQRSYCWEKNYHTTIVSALAAFSRDQIDNHSL